MIYNNENFTQLQANCFGNVTFEVIDISDTEINLVSRYALATSANTLIRFYVHRGFLTDATFPFNDLAQYTKLDYLSINYQIDMVWVSPLTSNVLTHLDLEFSSIGILPLGKAII